VYRFAHARGVLAGNGQRAPPVACALCVDCLCENNASRVVAHPLLSRAARSAPPTGNPAGVPQTKTKHHIDNH